ncbi:hypothetical protein N7G274_004754 [Stereocaulon virgatum]|uniref:LAGLIDADG homing endonuclease n=1 Tax=Stereocaulon virgatum TaxID=373712 RepID=A0ABR4A9Z9_9LECA
MALATPNVACTRPIHSAAIECNLTHQSTDTEEYPLALLETDTPLEPVDLIEVLLAILALGIIVTLAIKSTPCGKTHSHKYFSSCTYLPINLPNNIGSSFSIKAHANTSLTPLLTQLIHFIYTEAPVHHIRRQYFLHKEAKNSSDLSAFSKRRCIGWRK